MAPSPKVPIAGEPAPLEPHEERSRLYAILGGTARKGSWEPPAHLGVWCVMGGMQLDFREASLLEGENVVEIFVLMGVVEVTVPPDIHVHAEGTAVLGDFQCLAHRAREPGVPTLVIRGVALMGGVAVKVKKLPLVKRLRGGG